MTEYSDDYIEQVRKLCVRSINVLEAWGKREIKAHPELDDSQVRAAVTMMCAGWMISEAKDLGVSVQALFHSLDFDVRAVSQA
jgi:hypothetical protein